ncbi:uncharacterized protein PRCAT00005272001 [Priceomyces carsonii]|uniref:uncharacterized protein n=1 Tax=Priceomyces carsonii TaxID=28549 RepID=UPI002ED9F6BD|nr:unnamed protein product [Priceomyces carsonii]
MSYNGIGLRTTRGSGTSGYVQKSLALNQDRKDSGHSKYRQLLKRKRENEKQKLENDTKKTRARSELLGHENKRMIEVRCMELREELEDNNEDEQVILKKVNNLKDKLINESYEQSSSHLEMYTQNGSADASLKGTREGHVAYKPRYSDSTVKTLRNAR